MTMQMVDALIPMVALLGVVVAQASVLARSGGGYSAQGGPVSPPAPPPSARSSVRL